MESLFFSASTFYDSQSGKHVSISNSVTLHDNDSLNISIIDTCSNILNRNCIFGDYEDNMKNNVAAVISDAFQSDCYDLQTCAGSLGDKGFRYIVLADDGEAFDSLDADDFEHILETCLNIDIDTVPMTERIALSIPNNEESNVMSESVKEKLEKAIGLNIKHLCFGVKNGVGLGIDHPARLTTIAMLKEKEVDFHTL